MAHATLEISANSDNREDLVMEGHYHAMEPVVTAAVNAGHSTEDMYASLQPTRRDKEHALLTVDGVDFRSTRVQVGFRGDMAPSRGGLEVTSHAGPRKIGDKATTMAFKHALLETGNIGGKGGIEVSDEQWEDLGPDGRRELFRQHALAHGLDPMSNITATDIRTQPVHMDAIADSLYDTFGDLAPAAASGVSEKWGGRPDIQAMRTGLGGAIVLEEYLQHMATAGNQQARAALEGCNPLPVIVQGLGKAGMHFIQNLPKGTVLVGAMERNGGIRSEVPLNPHAVLEQSRMNGLDESSRKTLGGEWLSNTDLDEFWRSDKPCIVVPAFDKDQYTIDDAMQAPEGTVVLSLANSPVTTEAQKALPQLGITEIVGHLANSGGTLSSRLLWEKWFDKGWTPEAYDAAWRTRIQHVSRSVFGNLISLQQERNTFVPVAEVVDTIVARRSIMRARRARAL